MQYDFGVKRVKRRVEQDTDRPDFMSYALKAENERGLRSKICSQPRRCSSLQAVRRCLGASRCTNNPHTLNKLYTELGEQFEDEKYITRNS
ncbi:uncharacterized protein BCR38DRAFT_425920 [Pseudomassariella vexata]|uniref:Uncharacterized protein n=1 Tax=Pseudomassariella vexata TaxID=1141098 RepID=A0A1Y2E6I9_9PEZI|nr:uncharacterized protein BCR38DRAFT_425920 [Pseudomassariella vexata]ORY67057.1 hypothetical protein BCR38DRAFT_425920 [Pseudomassariella vexata]